MRPAGGDAAGGAARGRWRRAAAGGGGGGAEARLEQTQGARWRAVCGLEAPEASGAGEAGASAMKRTSEPTPLAAPRVEPVRAISPERSLHLNCFR